MMMASKLAAEDGEFARQAALLVRFLNGFFLVLIDRITLFLMRLTKKLVYVRSDLRFGLGIDGMGAEVDIK